MCKASTWPELHFFPLKIGCQSKAWHFYFQNDLRAHGMMHENNIFLPYCFSILVYFQQETRHCMRHENNLQEKKKKHRHLQWKQINLHKNTNTILNPGFACRSINIFYFCNITCHFPLSWRSTESGLITSTGMLSIICYLFSFICSCFICIFTNLNLARGSWHDGINFPDTWLSNTGIRHGSGSWVWAFCYTLGW